MCGSRCITCNLVFGHIYVYFCWHSMTLIHQSFHISDQHHTYSISGTSRGDTSQFWMLMLFTTLVSNVHFFLIHPPLPSPCFTPYFSLPRSPPLRKYVIGNTHFMEWEKMGHRQRHSLPYWINFLIIHIRTAMYYSKSQMSGPRLLIKQDISSKSATAL